MNTGKIGNFRSFVQSLNGRFVTVDYVKKDGTPRTINGRTGVTKHLKGGECRNKNEEALVIYSIKDKGYRIINLDTVTGIRANNMSIIVSETNKD